SIRTDSTSAQNPTSCNTKPAARPYSHRLRRRSQSIGTDSGAERSASATSEFTGATTASQTPNASNRQKKPIKVKVKVIRFADHESEDSRGNNRNDLVNPTTQMYSAVNTSLVDISRSFAVLHFLSQFQHMRRFHRECKRRKTTLTKRHPRITMAMALRQ